MGRDDDYDSGPFCQHWDDPSSCPDCAHTVEMGTRAEEALKYIKLRLDQLSRDYYDHAYSGSDKGCFVTSSKARELLKVREALTGECEDAAISNLGDYLMKRGES